ncbi:MAG TPA: beta-ketoacyl-ACP synthase [Afifellaceae bacterium]|nr:beta-ketoacyl-ACP synthase [Afifellaceae bacterium]
MSRLGGRDALITGIGLISPIGKDLAETFAAMIAPEPRPPVASQRFAPHPVYPLAEIDLNEQIPRRGDQRQMGPWQRYGTYAAGLALQDAGLKGETELLARTNLIVAAGGGERDPEADSAVLQVPPDSPGAGAAINESLTTNLRPTLFLAQLSNLLAGNISIVHNVTGSSRTFMGEELSGAMALQVAVQRIRHGQGDLFLVGGAYNAEREDMLLYQAVGAQLWESFQIPDVWGRPEAGGGLVPASLGAFLVLEAREHAEARGAGAYARLDTIVAESGPRDDEDRIRARQARLLAAVEAELDDEPIGLLSGASGAEPATSLERQFIAALAEKRAVYPRGFGTMTGHGLEAQMPAGVALAAAALRHGRFFPPFDGGGFEQAAEAPPRTIAVTAWGHWRGEAAAVIRPAD